MTPREKKYLFTVLGGLLIAAIAAGAFISSLIIRPRQWTYTLEELDDATLSIETRWDEGTVFYTLTLSEIQSTLRNSIRSAYFVLHFHNGSGQLLFEKKISLKKMTPVKNASHDIIALTHSLKEPCPRDTYRAIRHITLSWSFY